jgi:hypothetical protein
MGQVKNEIFTVYNKELGKYVDKLKIREEIVEMAREEEEFISKSKSVVNNGIKNTQQPEILIIKS